jgi:hypothetical protein
LRLWHQRGEESSLQRLVDDCWYHNPWQAEMQVASLAECGLIQDPSIYLDSIERHRVFFMFYGEGTDPAIWPRPGRHDPGHDGTWAGSWPMNFETNYPAKGQPVVYFLRIDGDVAYIGSTDDFRQRLKFHARTKEWTAWNAVHCESRGLAYDLEAEMILKYAPPLNLRGLPTGSAV